MWGYILKILFLIKGVFFIIFLWKMKVVCFVNFVVWYECVVGMVMVLFKFYFFLFIIFLFNIIEFKLFILYLDDLDFVVMDKEMVRKRMEFG